MHLLQCLQIHDRERFHGHFAHFQKAKTLLYSSYRLFV